MANPLSEYARLLAEARAALEQGHTETFEVTGEAARRARERGFCLEKIRRVFLAEALRQYIEEIRD